MNLYQGTPIEPPFVESHHQSKSSTWQQELKNEKLSEKAKMWHTLC
jgi:hypothetical protein